MTSSFNLFLLYASIIWMINTLLATFEFSCPAPSCNSDSGTPCPSNSNPHCARYGGLNDCVECEEGYWAYDNSYACEECLPTLGCASCSLGGGCSECTHGGTWTYSIECGSGINYCAGADTTGDPLTDDESTTADSTTDGSTTDQATDENTEDTTTTLKPDGTSVSVTSISTDGAIAYFTGSGMTGNVKITSGNFIVNIDASRFDFSSISEYGGESCFEDGLYYGIYDTWDHSDLDAHFGDDCSVEHTGSRWDPWLACSDYSNNKYCKNYDGSDNGYSCVAASSFQWQPDDNGYVCSEQLYTTNPFACEVGDLSGKYGKLTYHSNNKTIIGTNGSPFEIESYDLAGKILLLRCNDYTRIACSPFQEYTLTTNEKNTYYRPMQNQTFTQIAYLTNDKTNFVKTTYYNTFDIRIDVSRLTIPGTCGDEIYYRIFTDFSLNSVITTDDDSETTTNIIGTSDAACSDVVGYFYDPTVTCNEDSEHVEKGYCDDTQLCWDNDYTYTCETSGYYSNSGNRLACGPGDLSNKYGSIAIDDGSNFWFNRTGYDPYIMPTPLLEGKSIVFQCSNDHSIIACAAFEDYTGDVGLGNSVPGDWKDSKESEDSSEEDEKDSKNHEAANDNNIFGVSNTVAIVITVLLISALVPCVRAMRGRRKQNEVRRTQSQSDIQNVPRLGRTESNATGRSGTGVTAGTMGSMNTVVIKSSEYTGSSRSRSRDLNHQRSQSHSHSRSRSRSRGAKRNNLHRTHQSLGSNSLQKHRHQPEQVMAGIHEHRLNTRHMQQNSQGQHVPQRAVPAMQQEIALFG